MIELVPTPRCCPSHDGWAELAQHLIDLFPTMRAAEVMDVIMRSRASVEAFGLPENEHLQTVEIMSRYQLMQLCGQVPDNARLKPEDHSGRIKQVVVTTD
jgi:hypothetical protein